jgi:hypothetical protein
MAAVYGWRLERPLRRCGAEPARAAVPASAGSTLAEALARGELTDRQVVAVARALARLHARARPVDAVGVPALAVERRLSESLHQLLAMIEQRGEIERVLTLERFAHMFVVAHAQMFDQRARSGHVRDGHGDLRAGRVVLAQRRVEIIPGPDAEHAVTAVDVADDLAVLVVDVVAHDSRGGAVADAPLPRRSDRDAFTAGLAGAAPTLFIECRAPVVDPLPWEPLDEVAADAHLALRTDRPVESAMADILGLLDERIGAL